MTAAAMTVGSALSSDDWCTPIWLTELLGGPFGLDPCSNARSSVNASQTCRLDHPDPTRRDGLAFDWGTYSVFCNPPYSDVRPWAQKLAAHPAPWVALVKLDPTTRWWRTLLSANPAVAPFRKRIKFEGDLPMTANFPSVLVYRRWEPSDELAQHLWLRRYA